MNWLSRLLGKSKTDRIEPEAPTPEPVIVRPEIAPVAQPAPAPAPMAEPERALDPAPVAPLAPKPTPPVPQPAAAETPDLDEEDDEEPEGGDDEDPTIGRYEPLDEKALNAGDLKVLRAEAEALALSGPHKVGPSDPAGPGSLLETLMRLEEEGRMVSRVCDDPETGFYILYEPTSSV
jgi:hypothetical protein